MPPTAPKASQGTKLFQQDIIQKISSLDQYGIVLRCWHDAEDVPPHAPHDDPLMRPLLYGEVGVTFLSHGGSEREILRESELRLIDRTLQPGDYCKRSFDDVRSGVVTNIKVKGRLSHAVSGEKVERWWSLDDLDDKSDAEVGDYVAYDDWLGQIVEVFDESIVQMASGQLVRLPEVGSRLTVGDSGRNILPSPVTNAHNMFNLSHTNTEGKETVIAVRHNTYVVAWLALNQSLDPAIAEKKTRPKRFWYGKELSDLTLIRGCSDLEMRVGDRVHVKDITGLPYTEHGLDGDSTGVVRVHTFLVTETATELDVMWQDGTLETLKATQVIPYLNPDEYDTWPGDHVVWKTEDGERVAVVQSVNAVDRTALIFSPDTSSTELAPLLELDPHGSFENDVNNVPSDGYGVRRGDFVFIHKPGTTNGTQKPKVPRIGEIEPWVRENPFTVTEITSVGWRKELYELGIQVATDRSNGELVEEPIQRPVHNDGKLLWCGEVTGLNLDGTIEVTHPDWTKENYPLERLTRLYDGIEQLEDGGWEGESEGYHTHTDEEDDHQPQWTMDHDGVWRPEVPNDEWEDIPDTAENPGDFRDFEDMHDDTLDLMEVDQAMWESEDIATDVHEIVPSQSQTDIEMESPRPDSDSGKHSAPDVTEDALDTAQWSRFEILSSAPPDHAFYSSPHAQPSKQFLGRLNKEYRALKNGLPNSIIVRAYEDRTDLLRSLIIGPENTPYQDAPFIIDWMFDSNFPQSPPIAHFLSWTNGNGRVNPNLYEEGKVCLSILGTWGGDKSEIWSAARSSLLQALVSIQGLVLVKEPWFCEPAYDKLRGTEEGTVNSRLYSEKAFVLSRAFVRRALEIPLGGLQAEIYNLYYTRRRLRKVITDSEALIEKSRTQPTIGPEDQDLAVPRLTAGGIISLERTLIKLRALLENPPANPPSST